MAENKRISSISVGGSELRVEIVPIELHDSTNEQAKGERRDITSDNVSAQIDQFLGGMAGVKRMIRQVCGEIIEAFSDNRPDEFEVELKFGFGGEVRPIPFLASAKSDAAISVKATWKKT